MSSEKVEITKNKPYIILEGENRILTVIQWGDFGSPLESSTFKLLADNFMAREITLNVKYLKDFHHKMCVWIILLLEILFCKRKAF